MVLMEFILMKLSYINIFKVVDIINKVNQNKKIIGIGETGLDFYYNHSDKKDQINSFEEHISAAQEKNLPLIVHTRSAEKETLQILKKHSKKKILKSLFIVLPDQEISLLNY